MYFQWFNHQSFYFFTYPWIVKLAAARRYHQSSRIIPLRWILKVPLPHDIYASQQFHSIMHSQVNSYLISMTAAVSLLLYWSARSNPQILVQIKSIQQYKQHVENTAIQEFHWRFTTKTSNVMVAGKLFEEEVSKVMSFGWDRYRLGSWQWAKDGLWFWGFGRVLSILVRLRTSRLRGDSDL